MVVDVVEVVVLVVVEVVVVVGGICLSPKRTSLNKSFTIDID